VVSTGLEIRVKRYWQPQYRKPITETVLGKIAG
jgi:hypothetical protein